MNKFHNYITICKIYVGVYLHLFPEWQTGAIFLCSALIRKKP
jgi:hypothetical protein